MWTSPYDDLPPPDRSLPGLVAGAAARRPEAPALLSPAGEVLATRAGLGERTARWAALLSRLGLGRGDVLALWAPNSARWVEVALATQRVGAAVTGVPPQAADREVRHQLERTGAALVVADPALVPRARSLAEGTGVGGVLPLDAEPPAARGALPPEPGPDDVAALPMSSGTSGPPKAVVLTHRNLTAGALQIAGGLRLTDRDVVLALAPFPHVMGLVVTLAAPLVRGAAVVPLPRPSLPAVLEAVEGARVTVLAVPPPLLAALASAPQVDRHDLSSVEFLAAGGAPVPAALQERAARRFPGVVLAQGYGMTETSVAIPVPDRDRGTPPGSVGRLAPGNRLRVVDPVTGADLGPGQRGELWVQGPGVTPGYRGDPAATAELLTADGWLRTGDLGWVDAAGDLHVVDRLKDLIKVDARQVAPAELEELLLTHPAVADAAVTGRPDAVHGEVPVAHVVPRGPLDPVALADRVAGQVSPHKRLREVVVVDALPRSPAGKLARHRLAGTAAGAPVAAGAAGAGP
ncbi:AMP-binding protein [Geodermatophilus marinus]|uniref:AMP-binding protein n=1 Tax=Geodermatophilus sp. LHW52908 TaxID=2303986 RepID=UPI000E3C89CE|nr:AMP-binding protein [Geodermatophilus sp. LHW52908]RFU18871.1 4-coumarate--CoA ligase family protein [Geodermatophilus sp. LHW52908]